MDKTYHFVFASGGSIPAGAQPNGNEAPPTSDPLWVARSGNEVFSVEYEVLMEAGLWVAGDPGGKIPIGAVVCGEDADGGPLFVARAAHSGGVHPGKTRADWGTASISFGGEELFVAPFEILVTNDNALH